MNFNLKSQSIHDDVVGHNSKWMDFFHQDIRWNHMKVYEFEESAQDIREFCVVGVVTILLAPHQGSLKQLDYDTFFVCVSRLVQYDIIIETLWKMKNLWFC